MAISRKHIFKDSIRWTANVKNNDGSSTNLNGYRIDLKIVNKQNNLNIISINSNSIDSNMYITTNELNIGKYEIIIKNTSLLKTGDYYVNISYVSADGFTQTVESIDLKITDRL